VEWTLAELVDRATRALADVRVANGRVTEVPDGRLIRWYATKGLVDRPLSGPGRSARYGPRHLWQLVAVKRLQAQGHRLVEIQRRLTGATDATLRDIAGIASIAGIADLPAGGQQPASAERFWATPVAAVGHTTGAADSVIAIDSVERVIRIGEVTVRLPFGGELTPDDLAAITEAARPLLRVLTGLAEISEPREGARG
jgi:hypothetical protein